MVRFTIPHPVDSRGNRLENWIIRNVPGGCRVYLRCADAVARQVRWVFAREGISPIALDGTEVGSWTHAFELIPCPSERLESLLVLLQRILTLEVTSVLDLGTALDFYKDPIETESGEAGWKDTPAGSLVHRLKHRGDMTALDPLAGAMAQVIEQHEIFNRTEVVVSLPGHRKGWSYGEIIAEEIAKRSGRRFLRLLGRSDVRPEAKARDPNLDLTNEYLAPAGVSGKIITLVDDVYMTGQSSRAAATVMRAAGATGILLLVGARTRRN